MERVFRQEQRQLQFASYIAIAIREIAPGRRHTGIFFRVDENSDMEFMHLAWHCELQRDTSFSNKYCWVEPKIHKARLRQVAALCEDIASANLPSQIPYASGSPIDAFDAETKAFLLGPTRAGLTCASFVLAVFERAQLRLVKYDGWPPPGTADIEFQQFVLDNLEGRPGVSDEHIRAVTNEIGTSIRYRPEQVAGAACVRGRGPVKYGYAASLGNDIVRFLRGESCANEFRLSIWDRILNALGLL